MKAIILAAGEGRRLRPLTDDRPKCLVPFLGQPLIEHTLRTLRGAGISDITVVTGYRADRLEDLDVRTRHNPSYASTNMVHSLFCAEDVMEGDDVLVVYGDIVFATRVLLAMLANESPFAVAVDTDWRSLWSFRMPDPLADAETMRWDHARNIIELGQRPRSYDDIQGQYIGLIKVASEILPAVRGFYRSLDARQIYMTAFIQLVIDHLMPVKAVLVDGGWLEVDTIGDLEAYAHDETWVQRRLT